MTRIKADTGALEKLENDLRASLRRIERSVAELETGLAPLRERWTGEAAQAWVEHQRSWTTALADLSADLDRIQRLVSGVRRNYEAVFAANVRTWHP